MAIMSFKKRDRNRFSKVYPFVRFEKRLVEVIKSDLRLETGFVTFTSSSSESYTFTESYSSAPPVVITTVDSLNNDEANVNAYISSITTTSVTFATSAQFSGEVHFQVITG